MDRLVEEGFKEKMWESHVNCFINRFDLV